MKGEKYILKEGLLNMKELEIYSFLKMLQHLQTAKDAEMKKWLLSKDQVQGATRNTSSKVS